MPPIALAYLSPDPSSFPTYLSSEIPLQGPTSVTNSTHSNSKSGLPSTLPYSFPSNVSSYKPISDTPSDLIEYKNVEPSISLLPHSRLPTQPPSKEPPDTREPTTSPTPSFLLTLTKATSF